MLLPPFPPQLSLNPLFHFFFRVFKKEKQIVSPLTLLYWGLPALFQLSVI